MPVIVDFRDLPLDPDPLLFHGGELRTHLQARLIDARKTLENWEPDHLLQMPEHDIVEQLTRSFEVECPTLLRDQIQALPSQEGYSHFRDGFGDEMRQRIVVRRFVISFTGNTNVFALQASSFNLNPPRGKIASAPDGADELQISLQAFQGQIADPDQIHQAVHAELDKIDQHLNWARADIATYGQQLRSIINEVATRKAEILRERNLQADIGFSVRQRSDASRYAVPVRRKTIAAKTRSRTSPRAPFKPEPVMADQDFESVLAVLTASRNALERTPSMTASLTEEKIRDLLLVNLNAQFEGAAAGEVFNGAGKTDILIREKDRNIFIAECKIWKGPKTVSDALDQLLRYLVWRDTKAALLLFIRRGQPSDVIAKSVTAVEAHANYKRTVSRDDDGERSDYVVHANGDHARDIRLAFLPFVLPLE